MSAALAAANAGVRVTLMDRGKVLGGQLVKQTHRFFGSERERAGTRGIDIVKILRDEIAANKNIEVLSNCDCLGIYSDRVVSYEWEGKYGYMTAEKTIIATGAAEKMLNIGLIVTYQLLQAGVDVVAIVEAAPKIGGYKVHASKVRRMGVPIYTKTTCKAAIGTDKVTGAVLADVDDKFQIVPGTEREIEVDTICLAVGLAPLSELVQHTGCKMYYIPQLGGFVPERDDNLETTAKGFYIAGDVSCIEEATAAMIEGNIAGLSAAIATGMNHPDTVKLRDEWVEQLKVLRSGKTGAKIRSGMELMHGGQ